MPSTSQETTFIERLREERQRLGLSQARFAELGGVSRLAQWKYANGDHMPSVDYLLALAKSRVDVIYLLRGRRLTHQEMDWDVLRDAFLFVQKNMASKPGKKFTPEQLFEAFRDVWAAAMEQTYGTISPVTERAASPIGVEVSQE
jgi:transcriptional regulator with XRE-family HTH domain